MTAFALALPPVAVVIVVVLLAVLCIALWNGL